MIKRRAIFLQVKLLKDNEEAIREYAKEKNFAAIILELNKNLSILNQIEEDANQRKRKLDKAGRVVRFLINSYLRSRGL